MAGIPEKLFRKFWAIFTTRRDARNVGLGLSIAYNLVTHMLKGTIRCESILGKGTHFYLEFPVKIVPKNEDKQ